MHKLVTALVAAVVLALFAGAWAVLEVRHTAASLKQLLDEDVATLSSIHELAMHVEEGARNARMVLLTGGRFSDKLTRAHESANQQSAALARRLYSSTQKERLEQANALRGDVYLEMERAFDIVRAGDSRTAAARVLERVEPLRERLGDVLIALASQQKQELARRSTAYALASDRSLLFASLFGGAALLCGTVLAALLWRAVRRGAHSELRLRHIFQGAAVAIIEEDYSNVARALADVRARGVSDLAAHLEAQPALLGQLVKLVGIRDLNPAMRSLIELDGEEQLDSLQRFFSAETLPVFRDVLEALWHGRRQHQSETVVQSLSGERREALLTVSFPADLQHEPVVVTLTDVSERKREERRSREALERSEARLRAVFDQCPVGITMTDLAGHLVYMNPAAQQITAPMGASMGKQSLDLLGEQERQRIAEWRREFVSGRTTVSDFSVEVRTTEGTNHTLRVQANLLREGDQVHGIVYTMEDVTERLRLEDQLRQAQKMEAVGQLAGGIAHDFNNLLTVILNGASLLQSGASQDQAELLEQVEAAAERAASLTAQLLAFGRKQVIRPRPVDLNELVANHCRMLQRLVGEKIELRTKLDPAGAPAEVDPNLIELLLMNLVVNARDALPLGGKIVIALDTIVGNGVADGQHGAALVRLSVHDNGTGIEPGHLPHVFEPFFTTKTIGKGTGLGLSTVYGIVEQHHGRVEVETAVGQGTTFHIYLARADAPMAAWREPVESAPPGQETLLLVEDEAAVRQMVATSLVRCGYRVIEAANGDLALGLWRKHGGQIDLLLTDMVMPGSLSGRELAGQLRRERPELKVVYMSGYGAQDLGDEPWSILVQKPFQLSTLAQVLRARLDEREPSMCPRPLRAEASSQRVFLA